MLKINSYSSKGTKLTDIVMPKEWESEENLPLLAQAIRVFTDRSHKGLRKAQTRAEVSRTKKKLYSQKGTGGARHGSRGAPIFVGGGVAHGPRPVNRELVLPVQMRRKALAVTMTTAVKEDRIIAGDFDFKKTKETQNFIDKVLKTKKATTTFIVKKENKEVAKFIRNIRDVEVKVFPSINAFDIYFGGNIIFDKDIFVAEKKGTVKTKKVIVKKTK